MTITREPTQVDLPPDAELVVIELGLRPSGVTARAKRVTLPVEASVLAESASTLLVSVRSSADLALLRPTQLYLSSYCAVLLAPQVCERLNMAIYELYSNALQYGAASGEVKLELHKCRAGVRVTIVNQVEPEQLRRLEEQVRRVGENASSAFSSEMDRVAGGGQRAPMLGLVRVAHEGGFNLDFDVDGDRVSISVATVGEQAQEPRQPRPSIRAAPSVGNEETE